MDFVFTLCTTSAFKIFEEESLLLPVAPRLAMATFHLMGPFPPSADVSSPFLNQQSFSAWFVFLQNLHFGWVPADCEAVVEVRLESSAIVVVVGVVCC